MFRVSFYLEIRENLRFLTLDALPEYVIVFSHRHLCITSLRSYFFSAAVAILPLQDPPLLSSYNSASIR